MKVGIGYSDNPDTYTAGFQAARMAIDQAGRNDLCDMALLFSTARHDQRILHEAVISEIGKPVPIYGGGAVGVITNDYFGYAGDQIGLACIWLDGVDCKAIIDGGMKESEKETGIRLGRELAKLGLSPDSPVMLFYDALDRSNGLRMMMATWLLEGIEKGLGFFPDLTGAGLMGDHTCTPTLQFTGDGISAYNAIALAFSGDIRIDSVIMHGCRPATQYYTVTKAVGQVILEINGKPAIQFIDELLDSAIAPEQYPFFLIFGVNHGDRWGEYDEDYYASRLCLGIDKESGGIVMFEPDMVEGTEFRLMFRSLDLDYIKPKIEKVFDELDGREPVFAVYIDCAGRCAGYGGMDMEDAYAIQKTVSSRVPILGLYTGVEIAS
ncbi:MAG: FIST C-terminal domain-containing protein, partial [Acidobacteria bacterium]|nr:FIST C-terminal domain-containing protein [Acidobacteriota bacterium]